MGMKRVGGKRMGNGRHVPVVDQLCVQLKARSMLVRPSIV